MCLCLISWRTWKLQRKSISSNDAEVQAILEAEDGNFRARLLRTEIHGAGGDRPLREGLVQLSDKQTLRVKGVLCTDSRGGYDAVEVNQSPLLGLSNMRAALQAFQLRDNLKRVGCELRGWHYDPADALTKKKLEARQGLLKYLSTFLWSIAFDPTFTSSRKSKQKGKSVDEVDRCIKNSRLVRG